MTTSELIAFSSLAFAALSTIAAMFQRIFSRLSALETKVEIFWKGVSFDAAHILHSPDDHLGLDDLLEKFLDETITREELHLLVVRLHDKKDTKDLAPGERLAAAMMLRAIAMRYQ